MSVRDEGKPRMSNNTVERAGTNGASRGASLATNSVVPKEPTRRVLWRDRLTTVEAVTAAGPVDGGTSRQTVSEHEAVEEESLKITRNGGTGSWGFE